MNNSTLDQYQKLIEVLLDEKHAHSSDDEIICSHILDGNSRSNLSSNLGMVQSLIKKELQSMEISKSPEFLELFIINVTKYGPWFFLEPSNPNIEMARDSIFQLLKDNLRYADCQGDIPMVISNIRVFFNNHISVEYQDFLQKNNEETKIFRVLQEKLHTRIQDFPYFQKFSQLQASFLCEKINKIFENIHKRKSELLTQYLNAWLYELDNLLYKAFDPHCSDFSEGSMPPKLVAIGKNIQKYMSDPLPSKKYVDDSVPSIIDSVKKVHSVHSQDAEKSKINESEAWSKFKLDPDLKIFQSYVQLGDIEEVQSITLPQRQYYMNQGSIF